MQQDNKEPVSNFLEIHIEKFNFPNLDWRGENIEIVSRQVDVWHVFGKDLSNTCSDGSNSNREIRILMQI